jgi:vesicle coat complex subunit
LNIHFMNHQSYASRLDQAHHTTLLDIMTTLLRDRSPLSLGTAVLALDTIAPSRLDLLHVHFRRLCRALPDIDAWGQVDVLRVLVRYARTMLPKPVTASERQGEEVDKDLKLLLSCAEPLFMNKNPAVRTLFYFHHENLVDQTIRLFLLSHEHFTTLLPHRCYQRLAHLFFDSSACRVRLSVWHWLTCSSSHVRIPYVHP